MQCAQCGYAWSLNEGWYLWTTTVCSRYKPKPGAQTDLCFLVAEYVSVASTEHDDLAVANGSRGVP